MNATTRARVEQASARDRQQPATKREESSAPDLRTPAPTRAVNALLVTSVLFKCLLAVFATRFVLVDDAYIHLRYARNLVLHGEFVYNLGEPVFGLTSPLYGLITAGLYAITGSLVEPAVLLLNIVLWTVAGWVMARRLPASTQIPTLALFLFWPSFVDNQMLGMETPLFVLLLLLASTAALDGRIQASAVAFGWALITRPEAILLAPCLVLAVTGLKPGIAVFGRFLNARVLASLFGPGLAWCSFSMARYGGIIPQSMLAKSGWNSTHYDGLFTLKTSLLAIPRLTFLPFVDYLPTAITWLATGLLLIVIGAVILANVRRGSRASRNWLTFYLLYMGFYMFGKGATEASWYSIPSSVALLLASQPLLSVAWVPRSAAFHWAGAAGLVVMSTTMTLRRAPLLKSYVQGYGRSADLLNETTRGRERVLIGEIGVYGFRSEHDIIDVGALVSPQVLPMKNAGYSLCRMIRESRASYFVISETALETNYYPSVGDVWADADEMAWFDSCSLVGTRLDKRTFQVTQP